MKMQTDVSDSQKHGCTYEIDRGSSETGDRDSQTRNGRKQPCDSNNPIKDKSHIFHGDSIRDRLFWMFVFGVCVGLPLVNLIIHVG